MGDYSQMQSEVFKGTCWTGLGEYINNPFFSIHIFQFNNLSIHLFPQETVLDGNMFGFGMHVWILGYANGNYIVTINRDMMFILDLHFF